MSITDFCRMSGIGESKRTTLKKVYTGDKTYVEWHKIISSKYKVPRTVEELMVVEKTDKSKSKKILEEIKKD